LLRFVNVWILRVKRTDLVNTVKRRYANKEVISTKIRYEIIVIFYKL